MSYASARHGASWNGLATQPRRSGMTLLSQDEDGLVVHRRAQVSLKQFDPSSPKRKNTF